jgi:hypothetical protein
MSNKPFVAFFAALVLGQTNAVSAVAGPALAGPAPGSARPPPVQQPRPLVLADAVAGAVPTDVMLARAQRHTAPPPAAPRKATPAPQPPTPTPLPIITPVPVSRATPAAFVHPGVLETGPRLAFAKQIRAHAEPWFSAYRTMAASRFASREYVPARVGSCNAYTANGNGRSAETDDATAANTPVLFMPGTFATVVEHLRPTATSSAT